VARDGILDLLGERLLALGLGVGCKLVGIAGELVSDVLSG
jgi:hypothetical protein